VLTKITVTPNPYTLPAGLEYPFTATGEFSDKSSPRDISGTVVWSSSDAAIASSTPISAHPGLFTTLKPGDVTVSAAAKGLGGTVTGTALLHVVDAALLKIAVEPNGETIPLGLSKQYKATGYYTAIPKPLQVDLTAKVTWSISGDPAGHLPTVVGLVSNAPVDKGLLTTVAEGHAYVRATDPVTLISGSAGVTVSSAKVMDLAITPKSKNAPKGTYAQFKATCTDTANRVFDCTTKVMWVSEDKGAHTSYVAPLDSAGRFYGQKKGEAVISAFLPQSCEWCMVSGASAQAQLIITDATLVSLRVELQLPTCGSMTAEGMKGLAMDGIYMQPRFLPLRFAAYGKYSDYKDTKVEIDLTRSVNWGPNPDTSGVITWLDPHGVAMGLKAGHVDVRATLGDVVSPAFPLDIMDFVLDTLKVLPDPGMVAKGLDIQFQATGRFCPVQDEQGSRIADSSLGSCVERCVTPWMDWTEKDWPGYSGIATVNSAGKAHGADVGWATITAQDPQTGRSGSADLQVTAAIVLSVTVTPGSVQVPLGNTQQFRAIAHYSDGFAPDVTDHAYWADGAFVTFRHGEREIEGLGYTMKVSPGYVPVSANYHGTIGTALIQVLDRQLLFITVDPNPKSIPVGSEVLFLATGHYTGDFAQLLGPSAAVWDSSNESVAVVSNNPHSFGLATGFAKGDTTITAIAWDEYSKAYISGNASLTVGDPWIYRVGITPLCPSLIVDKTLQLAAWGYSTANPGVKVDATGIVGWMSHDPGIASVSSGGLVTGVGASPKGSSTFIIATEPHHGAFASTMVFVGCYCGKPVIEGGSCNSCEQVVSP